MRTTNKTVLDLSKVQHGTYFWINQYGNQRQYPPEPDSVYGTVLPTSYAAYHPDFPGETVIERARRLDLLDKWKPVVSFQLTANHTITYTGEKATLMWNMYCERLRRKK